jgi:hypothetical protein
MNVEFGTVAAFPFLGIFVSNFLYWFFAVQLFRPSFQKLDWHLDIMQMRPLASLQINRFAV